MAKGTSEVTTKIDGVPVTLLIPATRPRKGETPEAAKKRRVRAARKEYLASVETPEEAAKKRRVRAARKEYLASV